MRHRRRRDLVREQLALAAARAHLERIRAQWPAVHEAVATLDAHSRRNGFADAIRSAMGVKDR